MVTLHVKIPENISSSECDKVSKVMITLGRPYTKFLGLFLLCTIYYALLDWLNHPYPPYYLHQPYHPHHLRQPPRSRRTPDSSGRKGLISKSPEAVKVPPALSMDVPKKHNNTDPQAASQDDTDTLTPSNQEWSSNKLAPGLDIPLVQVSPGPYHVEYPHEYHFILDEPETCRQQKPFLVLMVPVAPYNREARDAIRITWGSERRVQGKLVLLFFLLALPSGDGMEHLQEKVLQESKEHQDLLQSDFIDCYKNLTIKTMVMMEWLSSRCPNASYAMKIDSDMFLNVNTLVNMLLLYALDNNYITGKVEFNAEVLRVPSSKWYLPWDVYCEPVYPPYTRGLGYVFSMDLPRKLVEASRHIKAIYIEDVYQRLCLEHLGIEPTTPPSDNLFQGYAIPQDRCHYMAVITTILNTPQELLGVWRDLRELEPVCFIKTETNGR